MRSRRKLIRTLAPSYNSTSSIKHGRGTERNNNGSGSVTSERADKASPSHQDQSETTKSTPQNVPKPNPSTRSLGTGTINQQRATDSRGGGGRGEVPTRKRSMRRWSGSWERSAILAMRRSAASRVRESSEGGRIGPDLDLERLFIAHSFLELEAKSPLPLGPRGRASPRCPRSSLTAPLPTPAPCCCVCRAGPKGAREAEEATTATRAPIGDFSRRSPLVSPRFSASALSTLCLRGGHFCDGWLN